MSISISGFHIYAMIHVYVKPCLSFVSSFFTSPVPCLIISLFHLCSAPLERSPGPASLSDYRSPCAWSNPTFLSLFSSAFVIVLVPWPQIIPFLPCPWRTLLPIWYLDANFSTTTDPCLNPFDKHCFICFSVNDRCLFIDIGFGGWIKNLCVRIVCVALGLKSQMEEEHLLDWCSCPRWPGCVFVLPNPHLHWHHWTSVTKLIAL